MRDTLFCRSCSRHRAEGVRQAGYDGSVRAAKRAPVEFDSPNGASQSRSSKKWDLIFVSEGERAPSYQANA